MAFETMKEYLSSLTIPVEDKRYVLTYCKKLEYLENLRAKASSDTGQAVNAGYGCANSQICLVFKDIQTFNEVKAAVQTWMDEFKMNFWQAWTTFVDKTEDEYPAKMEYLACEIHAVHPQLLYVFGDSIDEYHKVIHAFANLGIPVMEALPKYTFFIDIKELTSSDKQIKQEIWQKLRYLINFKTLDSK